MCPNQEPESPGESKWDGPTRDEVREAGDALIDIVADRLPERFYVRGEPYWRLGATALVARMAGLVDSVLLLLPAHRPSDTAILIRALYEYAVTTCWLLIDPTVRLQQWADHALRQRATMHLEAAKLGIEVLSDDELDHAMGLSTLPPLDQRAHDVDKHYGGRVRGFRPPGGEGGTALLNFGGLYTGLYRIASRSQHANVDALDACVDATRYPWRVQLERDEEVFWSALAIPLFALPLLAVADRLPWPDANEVRRINDRMYGGAVD